MIIISYLKIILKHIKQQSIIKIIFLNALSVINMCPEYDGLKKHIKTILEKDKNIDCNQCNLSTRAKWHLRAHIDTSHKYFVISGYSLNLLLHWNWRHEPRYWKDRRIKMHKHLNLLLHWNWRYEPRYWKDCIRIINFQFLIVI